MALYFIGAIRCKNFRKKLDNELMKIDVNNIEFQSFDNILLSVLNEYAPTKQKYLRTNYGSFITKDIRTATMKRS